MVISYYTPVTVYVHVRLVWFTAWKQIPQITVIIVVRLYACSLTKSLLNRVGRPLLLKRMFTYLIHVMYRGALVPYGIIVVYVIILHEALDN